MSNRDLWEDCLANLRKWSVSRDREAAQVALVFLEPEVMRIASLIVAASRRDDAVASVLERFLQKPWERCVVEAGAGPYLRQAIRNTLRDLERARRRDRLVLLDAPENDLPLDAPPQRAADDSLVATPEDVAARGEELAQGLAVLAPDERLTLVLADAPELLTAGDVDMLVERSGRPRDSVEAALDEGFDERMQLLDRPPPGETDVQRRTRLNRCYQRVRRLRERVAERLRSGGSAQ